MVEDPFDFPYRRGSFQEWAPPLLCKTHEIDNVIVRGDVCFSTPAPNLGGAHVLVVGGGGSANSVTYDGYDYIISMNHFFLHPVLSQTQVNLVGVGAGVNLKDEKFLTYVRDFNPVLAFEIHPNWSPANYAHLKSSLKLFYHTQVYGRIGMGVRLVNLSAALGAARISFIGFDGPAAILTGNHAFQPGKKDLPSLCNAENADRIHEGQYSHFWDYIRKIYPEVKFVSLDEENKYHKDLF